MDNNQEKIRLAIRDIIFSQGYDHVFTFTDIEKEAKNRCVNYTNYLISSVLRAMCDNGALNYKGNGKYIINK